MGKAVRLQYLYDAEGRICAVASKVGGQTLMTGYMYDADGIRVSKGTIQVWSCNPTTAQYATKTDYILGPGGEQMSEYQMQPGGSMAWQHTNVWVAGRLLATYEQNTTTVNGTTTQGSLLHFYLDDPLGTRRVQADYAGNLEQTCSSLPYGSSSQSIRNPAASPRPTQSSAVPSSITMIRCSPSPSRSTRKGRPPRSASICAFNSAALVCRGAALTA